MGPTRDQLLLLLLLLLVARRPQLAAAVPSGLKPAAHPASILRL
jgi:hypothetical protein